MAMNTAYLNALRDQGKTLITKIGLVDGSGTELSSSGYSRQSVTWADNGDGGMKPNADLVFTTASGDVVAGWVGYDDSDTAYGGADLTQVTFGNDGTYTLEASGTGVTISV